MTTNVGEDAWKKELSYTVDGNINYYNHYGKQYDGSIRNKNRPAILPSNTTPRNMPKGM
jgi:hypothetical protein